jgi:hypothetical protein
MKIKVKGMQVDDILRLISATPMPRYMDRKPISGILCGSI